MRTKFFIFFSLIIATLALLIFTSCTTDNINSEGKTIKRLQILTSFYPLYEIAKNIGGEMVDVKNLVPAGLEPHDYELTPQDVLDINHASLVIVNGSGLEPWFDKLRNDLQKKDILMLEMAQSMQKFGITADPHFWLDPTLFKEEIRLIGNKLVELDPAYQKKYGQNTQLYTDKIDVINTSFEQGLAKCQSRVIFTAHEAFGYLAKRYKLEMFAVAGFSPEADVSAKKLAELVQTIKYKRAQYIFTESLANPKIQETLAREAGIKTLTLNPLEGLTESEISDGKNYVSVMKENLKNLRTALNCE